MDPTPISDMFNISENCGRKEFEDDFLKANILDKSAALIWIAQSQRID